MPRLSAKLSWLHFTPKPNKGLRTGPARLARPSHACSTLTTNVSTTAAPPRPAANKFYDKESVGSSFIHYALVSGVT